MVFFNSATLKSEKEISIEAVAESMEEKSDTFYASNQAPIQFQKHNLNKKKH